MRQQNKEGQNQIIILLITLRVEIEIYAESPEKKKPKKKKYQGNKSESRKWRHLLVATSTGHWKTGQLAVSFVVWAWLWWYGVLQAANPRFLSVQFSWVRVCAVRFVWRVRVLSLFLSLSLSLCMCIGVLGKSRRPCACEKKTSNRGR